MHPVSEISTRITQAELDGIRKALDWAWTELETSASPAQVDGVKRLKRAREVARDLQDRLDHKALG